jgi:hypothetical protein
MKTKSLITALCLLTCSLFAADSKDDITTAAKKLAEQPNYSWKTTVVVPESARFKPGPTDGKTEKDGFAYAILTFGDNLTEIASKGEKAVITNQDGDWQLASELEAGEGRGRFLGRMARNFKPPAAQVPDLVAATKDGMLIKFETKVEAKMEFNGEEVDASRTTTTEIKDVGTTKVNVPAEAKKKLG